MGLKKEIAPITDDPHGSRALVRLSIRSGSPTAEPLLLNLCLAGVFSPLLPSSSRGKTRVKRFLGKVQESLLDAAQ